VGLGEETECPSEPDERDHPSGLEQGPGRVGVVGRWGGVFCQCAAKVEPPQRTLISARRRTGRRAHGRNSVCMRSSSRAAVCGGVKQPLATVVLAHHWR
jgi:hypothetical protein